MKHIGFRIWVASLFFYTTIATQSVIAGEGDLPGGEFLGSVLDVVKSLGGLSWAAKIAVICALLTSSLKVSFLRAWVWDRLGAFKVLVAPVLALVAGLASLAASGGVTLAGVGAYLFAGAGAIVIHQLCDALKSLPAVGGWYVAAIDFIERLAGGKPGPALQTKS